MPQLGDVYSLTDHERLTVTTLTDDLLEVDVVWDGADEPVIPLPHRHPHQAEHFVVHEGELTASVDGQERTFGAGDTIDVRPGTAHAMWNASPNPVHATWQVRPPMRTAQLWQTLTALRADGRTPTPEEGAELLAEFAPEFELVF